MHMHTTPCGETFYTNDALAAESFATFKNLGELEQAYRAHPCGGSRSWFNPQEAAFFGVASRVLVAGNVVLEHQANAPDETWWVVLFGKDRGGIEALGGHGHLNEESATKCAKEFMFHVVTQNLIPIKTD